MPRYFWEKFHKFTSGLEQYFICRGAGYTRIISWGIQVGGQDLELFERAIPAVHRFDPSM